MIESFSSAYYISSVNVEEYGGDDIVMSHDMYESISSEVYGADYPTPLVVKLDDIHAVVVGEGGLPPETMAISSDIIDMFEVDAPSRNDIFIAKSERAGQIASWILGESYGAF